MQQMIIKYSDIEKIADKKIIYSEEVSFDLTTFERVERDITAEPPFFSLKSFETELRVEFERTGLLAKYRNKKDFLKFQKLLTKMDIRSLDLS